MATTLGELDDHVDFDLYLPINGVTYRIAAPSIEHAERVRMLPWLSYEELPADAELAELETLLGPALVQMREHGVSAPVMYHAGRTAVVHFAFPQGPELGRVYWLLGDLTQRLDFVALMRELAAGTDPSLLVEALTARRVAEVS